MQPTGDSIESAINILNDCGYQEHVVTFLKALVATGKNAAA